MKPLALILNAVMGLSNALPYRFSSVVEGLCGALYVPIKGMLMLTPDGRATIAEANNEREAIRSYILEMFAKRAIPVNG